MKLESIQKHVSKAHKNPSWANVTIDIQSALCLMTLFSFQSYIPSCSHMSTRKSTISERGMGRRNGLLLPSKFSYVAFQLNLGSWICCARFADLLFPIHFCLVWIQRRRPRFTNSEGLLKLPWPPWESRAWFNVPIDEMLPCDWTALLSISRVLVVQ